MKDTFKKERLNAFLSESRKAVEDAASKLLFSYLSEKTRRVIGYQILTGGKRMRPALAIASCQLLGGDSKDVLYPAAGLEILHNYSLIIDDIIDNSRFRRGKPTIWSKFGRSIAECVAMDYSATIFQAANQSKKPTVIAELFAKTIKTLVDGEILDILFEQAGRENEPYVVENRYREITKDDYFKMVSQKTAALFQASCEVGAICANAKKEEVETLKKFGFNLGMAFQIQDDILDIFGEEKTFGKKIGKDIEESKGGNIVTIFALEELGSDDRKKLIEIIKKRTSDKKEITVAVDLIRQTKAHKKARQMGEQFVERAKKYLEALPQNEWNNILREIADFAIERKK